MHVTPASLVEFWTQNACRKMLRVTVSNSWSSAGFGDGISDPTPGKQTQGTQDAGHGHRHRYKCEHGLGARTDRRKRHLVGTFRSAECSRHFAVTFHLSRLYFKRQKLNSNFHSPHTHTHIDIRCVPYSHDISISISLGSLTVTWVRWHFPLIELEVIVSSTFSNETRVRRIVFPFQLIRNFIPFQRSCGVITLSYDLPIPVSVSSSMC